MLSPFCCAHAPLPVLPQPWRAIAVSPSPMDLTTLLKADCRPPDTPSSSLSDKARDDFGSICGFAFGFFDMVNLRWLSLAPSWQIPHLTSVMLITGN